MRYLFLCLLGGLLSLSNVNAQRFMPDFHFGLGADALISPATPTAQGGSVAGSGRQFYAWSAYQWQEMQRLQLSLGYRVLGGYQWQEAGGRRVFTPTQVQEFLYLKELIALRYVDAELGWQARWRQHPRWSVQAGVRLAYLAGVQGREEEQVRVTGLDIRNLENQTGMSSRFVVEPIYERPLDRSDYPTWDFGLSLGLLYQLTEGLDLRLGTYAGLQEVLGAGTGHRIRSLSLGLQARIF